MGTNNVTDMGLGLGPRGYHNTGAAYTLPNDEVERYRLEGQAEGLRAMMNNKVFHAPLSPSSLEKVLDIGCGTGIVTNDLASDFPAAHVLGVDLSPVPEVRPKLPNIEYIEGNISSLVGSDPRFEAETFDYVFARLLVAGMTDWSGHVKQCASLLKPGGWLEFHELDVTLHRAPETFSDLDRGFVEPHEIALEKLPMHLEHTDAWRYSPPWDQLLRKLCGERGLDFNIGRKLGALFDAVGLEDVTITRYIWPTTVWEGMTNAEKRFAEHQIFTARHIAVQQIAKMGEKSTLVGKEELAQRIEEATVDDVSLEGTKSFFWLFVVRGRKVE